MILARVTGTVVASRKSDRIEGGAYLVVEECGPDGSVPEGAKPSQRLIAVDTLGAGPGEVVMVSQGSSARQTEATKNTAVDAVVAGIVDLVATSMGAGYRK
jgi:microcompartment protein CcmK/EutM